VRRATVLVLVALALGACGRKGTPIAPELVRPEPPAELAAIVTPDGVRLSWLRPLHYSGGQRMNDLQGFRIERAPGDGDPADFTTVGTLELEDQTRFKKERRLEWIDKTAEPGRRYLYRVTAFTLDGYRSRPAGPVAVRFGPA
jgi:hypothetical protein